MSLAELRDRVLTLPALEKKMESLTQDIRRAENEVSDLLERYESESRDVEQMRKESFSAFLLKMLGKYEDKLEKEQREEINAKIAYDCAIVRRNDLISEKDELASRISVPKEDEKAYLHELENRRLEISGGLSEPERIRYAEIEREQGAIISQITEIKEALRAAARAKSTADKIVDSLERAEDWATFDAFTRGGFISHMAKYSHIDKAERNFGVLSSNLRELKSELEDVREFTVSGLNEISSGQRAVDFWFDNIFTDLLVCDEIRDNSIQIKRLIRNIIKAESALKARLSEIENELAINRQREEELLLSITR